MAFGVHLTQAHLIPYQGPFVGGLGGDTVVAEGISFSSFAVEEA